MSIRNGEWLDDNKQPIQKFYRFVDKLEERFREDIHSTKLPDNPDYKAINDFVLSVNERIVKEEIF